MSERWDFAAEETRRIRSVFAERHASGQDRRYGFQRPDALYMAHRAREAWAEAFERAGIVDLSAASVLDVGCGNGAWLRMLAEWGAEPVHLHGIDLVAERIAKGKILSPPAMDLRQGEGWPLPYADRAFDLAAASTVFSSILDPDARLGLGREMQRTTRPGGWIMVFDFAISHPRNPDTVGMGREEMQRCFAGDGLAHVLRVQLAPPILRRFPRKLHWAARALEACCPPLRSHRLYLFRRA